MASVGIGGSVGAQLRAILSRSGDARWADVVASLSPDTDGVGFAEERLGILNSIIRVAIDADTIDDMVVAVRDAICERFTGLLGAVARYEAGTVTIDADDERVDWAEIVGLPPDDPETVPAIRSTDQGVALTLWFVDLGSTRYGLSFIDIDKVVPLPRHQLAAVALECAYVLDRELAASQLLRREAEFRAVFDASPIPQALMEDDRREFAVVNDALCELVGYSRDHLVGRSARDITFADDIPVIEAARDEALADPAGQHRVERRMIHSTGAVIYTETTLTWIYVGNGSRMLLQQVTDITAQRRVEAELLEQMERDSLTGLPNRLRAVREISELGHRGQDFGVLFLDLDSFKSINEARGHDTGDEVLIDVAGRLADIVDEDCLVARFGGDEFVIVCTAQPHGRCKPMPLAEYMDQLAQSVQRVLSPVIDTSIGPIHVTASIGVCDDTIPVSRPLDRLQYADTAAYRAKRLGEDRHVAYDARLHSQSQEFARIEALLRTALDEERLIVHYQPIVDVSDGYPVGVEALVRMADADGTLIQPAEFIEVAERSGLIVPIGNHVLTEATRTIADLSRRYGIPGRVSVNIAARQAARPGLVESVLDALGDCGLEAKSLTLELTESALLEADSDTLRRLFGLRERGVQIALDDFGTGYSSLSYLRKLPVSRIKVDRSFVTDMTTDAGSAAIVRAVTTLARDLGLAWVAEGVETVSQWRALREIGPGMAQGYYFSRPQPAEKLPEVMAALVESATTSRRDH